MEHRKANIRHFRELDVYQLGMESAMRIFELSKLFPAEEKYSLDGSDPTILAFCVCKYRRGMA